MGNLKKGSISSSQVSILAVLGAIASVAGLILTIVFRIQDRRIHKTKESNRQTKDELLS